MIKKFSYLHDFEINFKVKCTDKAINTHMIQIPVQRYLLLVFLK
ncbi:MAG: hypothetical protein ACI9RO_000172 [Alteromonas macleodii]|jgi:hypothetical protein